jgi:hypothetical protein
MGKISLLVTTLYKTCRKKPRRTRSRLTKTKFIKSSCTLVYLLFLCALDSGSTNSLKFFTCLSKKKPI